jgi:hypothetical protein
MSRRLCEVLPCMQTATHWVDNGRGDDSEYCEEHATEVYDEAMEQYREIHPDQETPERKAP